MFLISSSPPPELKIAASIFILIRDIANRMVEASFVSAAQTRIVALAGWSIRIV